jgi:hypothetical protein
VRRDRTSKRLGNLSLGPIESGVGVRDAMVGGDMSTGRWKEYCSRCSRWVANVRAARGWSVVGHDVPLRMEMEREMRDWANANQRPG